MSELTHSFRPNMFASERTVTLTSDALLWKDGKGEGRLPLTEVAGIHLYDVPAIGGLGADRCVVTPKSGRKFVLQDAHYIRFGATERRTATYKPLVETLLKRVAAANPQARLVAGQSWAMWVTWLILFIGSTVVMAGGLILFAMGEFPLPAVAVFALIILFLPASWRIVRHGRPRRLDPGSLK